MLTLMVGSIVGATVQWSSAGRRGQMNARGEMLSVIATWAHAEGVDHLVIEAGDEAINLRDRQVLARHPLQEGGGLRFHYDHRSKSEPLLWIADALAGAVGEHLIGKNSAAYDRLVTAGVVAEVDDRGPKNA